jgi:protein-S-isoprenylcysteine O-methyltransferase Ste14
MNGLKIYLPLYMVLYLLAAFVIPSYRTYKRTGINPVTFGRADNAHDYIGFIMKLLVALLFIGILLFSLGKQLYWYLVPIPYLENYYCVVSGLVLIHVSLLWIGIAQYQMGISWRIGIDEQHKTKLVTQGIFSISRNPIFLGMIVSVFGLFLIIPNSLTFFLSLCTYVVIQIQIRLEEEFLSKQHGKEYEAYKVKTKRLL